MTAGGGGRKGPARRSSTRWRRVVGFAVVAGLIVLSYFAGAAATGYLQAGACWASDGVWSDRFGVCECANYGGRWQDGRCVGAKVP